MSLHILYDSLAPIVLNNLLNERIQLNFFWGKSIVGDISSLAHYQHLFICSHYHCRLEFDCGSKIPLKSIKIIKDIIISNCKPDLYTVKKSIKWPM